MNKLLLLFLLSTSLSTFANQVFNIDDYIDLDFSLSDFCFKQPGVQDRQGVLYFPNEEEGISDTSICVYKDAYGQYESKGDLLDGLKNGEWKEWSQNGELLEEKFYIDGVTGTIACLDYTQNIITLNDEPFTGLNICKYEDVGMSFQVNVIGGKKEGRFTIFYEDGQKSIESNFIDGKEDGRRSTWYRNGLIAGEGYYKNGNLDGKATLWYENGQKESEWHYKDNKEDGKFTKWYDNGQKMSERTIKDGWEYGKETVWYENGQKSSEGNSEEGKAYGKHTSWHENGQIKSVKFFRDGECLSGDC